MVSCRNGWLQMPLTTFTSFSFLYSPCLPQILLGVSSLQTPYTEEAAVNPSVLSGVLGIQMSVCDLRNLVPLKGMGLQPQNQLIHFPSGSVDNRSHNPTRSLEYFKISQLWSLLICHAVSWERVLIPTLKCLMLNSSSLVKSSQYRQSWCFRGFKPPSVAGVPGVCSYRRHCHQDIVKTKPCKQSFYP